MPTSNEKLTSLYAAMSELTAPECATACRVPHSCCSAEYCDMAESWAKDRWNVDISAQRTDHPTLPFMGPRGCVLKPHFRPSCTLHTCAINGIGAKVGDPKWTRRYFWLRRAIESVENKRG
jgi:hypothetical protein